jgi:hypothetical protein
LAPDPQNHFIGSRDLTYPRKPAMNTTAYALFAAELNAERAGVQELRIRIATVRTLRASLDGDTLEWAKAVLLKLGRLAEEQTVEFA